MTLILSLLLLSQTAASQPIAAPTASSAPANPYGKVMDLVGSSSYLVLLRDAPEPLIRLDDKGQPVVTRMTAELKLGGKADFAPVALSWARPKGRDNGGAVLVLADGGASIYRFDADLQPLGRIVHDDKMRGSALCVDDVGNIYVADKALPGIRAFDAHGQPLASVGTKGAFDANVMDDAAAGGKFMEPTGICRDVGGRLLVADRGNMTFVIYSFDPVAKKMIYLGHGPWMSRPYKIMTNRVNQIVLTGALDSENPYGALRVLQATGAPVNGMAGYDIGMMSPNCTIAMGPHANMFIADPDRGHVLVVPFLFYEQRMTILPGGPITMQIQASKIDRTGDIYTTVNYIPVPSSQPAWLSMKQQTPLCEAWPTLPLDSLRALSVPILPTPGRNYVIDMPVVVAVFLKARVDGKDVSLSKAELGERLQRELPRVRDFYFRHSQGLLNLQFEIMVIDDATAHVDGGWIPPSAGRRLVNDARRKAKLEPLIESDSLIALFPMKGWDKDAVDDDGVVGGSGMTDFAYSSFGLWNSGIAWLFAHEWNHQLDKYFDRSGLPEFWLNQPDSTIHFGRFGQNWDFDAFLMRRFSRVQWLQLKYGFLRLVKDSDGDGLADDDESLPLDEKRASTDPLKADTDGDGLTDCVELTGRRADDMAVMQQASYAPSDPLKSDMDGDGLPDATDPYPAFPVKTTLLTQIVKLDGVISPGEYNELGKLNANWLAATVSASREQSALHIAVEFDQPIDSFNADVDLDANGWFTGFDNIPARIDLTWKNGAATLAKMEHCTAVIATKDGRNVLEMNIPFQGYMNAGPAFRGGLGLCVHARVGAYHEAFLIEPWALLRCEFR